MSVYENMAFGLRLRNFSVAEIDTRVREAAAMLQIESLLDCKPKAPGGQRQRVAVGRAIVRKPKVFSSTSRSNSTPRCALRPAPKFRNSTNGSGRR